MSFKIKGIDLVDANSSIRMNGTRVYPFNTISESATISVVERYAGTTAGFIAAGTTAFPNQQSTRDRWPFATDANASDIGALVRATNGVGGHSSMTHGYVSTGQLSGLPGQQSGDINRYPFASFSPSASVGSVAQARDRVNATSSDTAGYIAGGYGWAHWQGSAIQNFPFATTVVSRQTGSIGTKLQRLGNSSPTHGYASGGSYPGPTVSEIRKYPFVADGDSAAHGNLPTPATFGCCGQESESHAYGVTYTDPAGANPTNGGIIRFPFATNAGGVVYQFELVSKSGGMGVSSQTHGYNAGGWAGPGITNSIEKFPFATNSTATDVGDLIQARALGAPSQD